MLAVVQDGYLVPFKDGPPRLSGTPSQIELPSNSEKRACLLAELQALQDMNAIEEVSVLALGFYIFFLWYVPKDRRLETCIDLSCLFPRRFKAALRPGVWFPP